MFRGWLVYKNFGMVSYRRRANNLGYNEATELLFDTLRRLVIQIWLVASRLV